MTWRALCAGQGAGDTPVSRAMAMEPARVMTGSGGGAASVQAPMASGAVIVEFVHRVSDRPENILRYRARDPVTAAFGLRLDPDGTLALLLRQGAATSTASVPLGAVHPGERVRVSYHWRPNDPDKADGPGEGILVAAVPARGLWASAPVPDAIGLTGLDADRIAAALAPGSPIPQPFCTAEPGLVLAAIADSPFPAGPLPGIDGRTTVATLSGRQAISTLVPGAVVLATDGAPATVLWAGAAAVPALGSMAPHVMRAPFYGLRQDMIFAGEQCLYMSGTEVEYLFFQEEVAVAVADLADKRAVALWPGGPVATYHQVLLDRPALLQANGAALPPLDAAPLFADPGLRRWSVLADYRPGTDAEKTIPPLPALRGFEAATLRRMRAA